MDARIVDYETGSSARQERCSRPLVLINHMVEPPARITGITRYAFGLIEALVRRGAARYVLATCWDASDLPAAIANGVDKVITLPHVRSTPLNFLRQRRVLARLARDLKPDFVHAVNPMCPAAPGIPTMATVHDLYYEEMPELYAFRHRLWWAAFFAGPARSLTRIACVSGNTAKDFARFHPQLAGKSVIVPGAGVLPAPECPALQSAAAEPPYILMLGNVTPNKNAPFLVEALKLLHAQRRPVRLVHVGRDHSGELARAMAGAPAGLIENLGGLDDAALDALMRRATALVQPSLYEGFGLPIIEAHDRGVPVIASDIEVFREVAADGADFVPLGDVYALAEALHRIVADAPHRAALAARASANASRFTWANSAAAMENAMFDAMSANSARR